MFSLLYYAVPLFQNIFPSLLPMQMEPPEELDLILPPLEDLRDSRGNSLRGQVDVNSHQPEMRLHYFLFPNPFDINSHDPISWNLGLHLLTVSKNVHLSLS